MTGKYFRLLIIIAVVIGIGIFTYVAYGFYERSQVVELPAEEFTPTKTLDELTQVSSVILVGKPLDDGKNRVGGFVKSAESDNKEVYTDYRISASETLTIDMKDLPSQVFQLAVEGGTKDGKNYMHINQEKLIKNQEYVIFATTDNDGILHAVTGGNAIAKKTGASIYELPKDVGLSDNTFTIDELRQAIASNRK